MSGERTGIVTFAGWRDIDGERVFCAVVAFPEGPPDLPFSVIWNATPVRIVPIDGPTRERPAPGEVR